jgi:hypothetical protein
VFIKLTRSSGHTYAQLVESYRDEHSRPRQRTLATLGRVDEDGGQVDALMNGLLRAKGRTSADAPTPQVRFESALAVSQHHRIHGRLGGPEILQTKIVSSKVVLELFDAILAIGTPSVGSPNGLCGQV